MPRDIEDLPEIATIAADKLIFRHIEQLFDAANAEGLKNAKRIRIDLELRKGKLSKLLITCRRVIQPFIVSGEEQSRIDVFGDGDVPRNFMILEHLHDRFCQLL